MEKLFHASREKIIQAYGKQLADFEVVFRGEAAGTVFHASDLLAGNSQLFARVCPR